MRHKLAISSPISSKTSYLIIIFTGFQYFIYSPLTQGVSASKLFRVIFYRLSSCSAFVCVFYVQFCWADIRRSTCASTTFTSCAEIRQSSGASSIRITSEITSPWSHGCRAVTYWRQVRVLTLQVLLYAIMLLVQGPWNVNGKLRTTNKNLYFIYINSAKCHRSLNKHESVQ